MAYRHHRHCGHDGHGGDESGMGCLMMLILGILAMSIVGLFMVMGKDENMKGIGLVLLIVGVILWIMIAAQG